MAAVPVAARRARISRDSGPARFFLRGLNVFGLDHLQSVILAALADEAPMLLIGTHGTAKSALLNRIAHALSLEHRHYNASLLSFDDLLGYPVPNAERSAIEYLDVPESIWRAESVFLDEISRCRPEVQNKLFSIVHERRVQGKELVRLRYRWAAMNPPTADPLDARDEADVHGYEGSLPLDPALADRFAYVIVIPGIGDLAREDRLALIAHGGDDHPRNVDLPGVIAATRERMASADARTRHWLQQYVEALLDPLRDAGLRVSGRRAGYLYRNALAIHAAERVLHRRDSLEDAAFVALKWGLPQRARGVAIEEAKLQAIHKAALDLAGKPENSIWRRLRRIADPIERLAHAVKAPAGEFDRLELTGLVTDIWADLTTPQRYVLARHLLPHLTAELRVTVPCYEMVAAPVLTVHRFVQEESHKREVHRTAIAKYQDTISHAARLAKAGEDGVQLGNVLLALRFVEDETFDADVLVALDARCRALFGTAETSEAGSAKAR
jgi:MoxR-like ATPase